MNKKDKQKTKRSARWAERMAIQHRLVDVTNGIIGAEAALEELIKVRDDLNARLKSIES